MSYNLRRLQEEQLTVLDELKRVCDENDLTFFLAAGTAIGAMRHHAFIPWDDDIDVFMHVNDFDKLMSIPDAFSKDYFLQNSQTDPSYPLAIARVRKNGTACVEKDEMNINCHHGIYLDIYPIYQIPDSFWGKIRIINASIMYRILLLNRAPQNHGRLIAFVGNSILKILNKKREVNLQKYYSVLRSYSNTQKVGILYGMDLKIGKLILYKREWFEKPMFVEFEGRKMPISTDPILYLQCRYGEDVMEMPPIEKQKSYHQYEFVSFDSEYTPKMA